ncbi:MAG TPA: hypothetical protein DE314_00065 [Sulfitobacter sp.]|nr:hypothetical protein [Sulfitobacter sp.]
MSTLTLTPMKLRRGVWEAVISNSQPGEPQITVTHLNQEVPGFELAEKPDDNLWLLQVPIPQDAIADGVQTFAIGDKADGTRIGHFTLIAGEALGDDMRVEVELLRTELDMLKRAFRRHCVETT